MSLPKPDLEKNETAQYRMTNPMAYVHNENHAQQKKGAYFRRFWVKELRHSETIFAKKRYTSIVARVFEVMPRVRY